MKTSSDPRAEPPIASSAFSNRTIRLLAVAWFVAVAIGCGWLAHYAKTAGDPGHPAAQWPVESALPRPAGRPSLVMIAHPRCPCTRASLAELARLMTRAGNRLSAHIVFTIPERAGQEWTETALWEAAKAIPGITAHRDPGGAEARRFGTGTSGHTLVYSAKGRLEFSGGITGSRGHEGDNAGRAAIASILGLPAIAEGTRTPVFGCTLPGLPATPTSMEAWKP